MLLEDPRARRIVDLVRAVGILLVIFFHVLYGLARLLPDAARLRFTVEFPNALAIGWQALGSELIFLFSGFLVSYVLIVEHREAGRIAYGPYLWRRAARILPLYYAALAFYTLTLQPEVWDIAASAVLLGFILRDENVIPVGWSMEAMVQVYIVLPLLVRYILRGRSGLRILGLIAASVLARVLYVALSPDTFETFYIGAIETTKFSDAARELYFMAWFRATPFLIGLGLAWLVLTHHDRLRDRLSEPRLWLPALALGLLAAGAHRLGPGPERRGLDLRRRGRAVLARLLGTPPVRLCIRRRPSRAGALLCAPLPQPLAPAHARPRPLAADRAQHLRDLPVPLPVRAGGCRDRLPLHR